MASKLKLSKASTDLFGPRLSSRQPCDRTTAKASAAGGFLRGAEERPRERPGGVADLTQTRSVWDWHMLHTLTPVQPPQLIGNYASPMECLGHTSPLIKP